MLICGKCNDENYLREINALITSNITLINEYIDENMLARMISESKVVLFCHSSKSILSSGALVYSLSYFKPIIAPNVGAFKDYNDLNLIQTYNDFSEIQEIACKIKPKIDAISNHLINNTWYDFCKILIYNIEKNQN
jgi:hypothetical protein